MDTLEPEAKLSLTSIQHSEQFNTQEIKDLEQYAINQIEENYRYVNELKDIRDKEFKYHYSMCKILQKNLFFLQIVLIINNYFNNVYYDHVRNWWAILTVMRDELNNDEFINIFGANALQFKKTIINYIAYNRANDEFIINNEGINILNEDDRIIINNLINKIFDIINFYDNLPLVILKYIKDKFTSGEKSFLIDTKESVFNIIKKHNINNINISLTREGFFNFIDIFKIFIGMFKYENIDAPANNQYLIIAGYSKTHNIAILNKNNNSQFINCFKTLNNKYY